MMRKRQIQGISWGAIRRSALACFAVLGLAWAVLGANPTAAMDEQDGNGAEAVETRQMRRDNVFGTTDGRESARAATRTPETP